MLHSKKQIRVIFCVACLLLAGPVFGEESVKAKTGPSESKLAEDKIPRMIPVVDYSGDFWTRPALTGDWGGVRQDLMNKGIQFNLSLTQVIQGNAVGGSTNDWYYMGNLRYEIKVDTGHAGLWPGGLLVLRGETQYGRSDNLETGALMPANMNSLYPMPNEQTTCLTEAYYVQAFAPWGAVTFGKYSPRDNNVFAHDETTQFMNVAMNINPVIATTLPLNALGMGVIIRPVDWFTLTTMLIDSEGTASRSGFDTAFEGGTTVTQTAEFTIHPFGLEGHQRISWSWSDKQRTQLGGNGWLVLQSLITGNPPDPTAINTTSDDWCIYYDFDQYIYRVPDTKDGGLGVFGRFGLTNGKANPIKYFYSLGVAGKGLIETREQDTFGVGYYYIALSDNLPKPIAMNARDESGIEMYYNFEITPWLHVTPDIQIIQPANKNADTTVVAGIRMKMEF